MEIPPHRLPGAKECGGETSPPFSPARSISLKPAWLMGKRFMSCARRTFSGVSSR